MINNEKEDQSYTKTGVKKKVRRRRKQAYQAVFYNGGLRHSGTREKNIFNLNSRKGIFYSNGEAVAMLVPAEILRFDNRYRKLKWP